ncbi:hypothetical protein F4778DRAFT_452438 [Xylariomycetidae sp. FL2044]|nr:hypothetical protein F4778DRAFT_452438 [Xylariomycetidae sp. FL2044]
MTRRPRDSRSMTRLPRKLWSIIIWTIRADATHPTYYITQHFPREALATTTATTTTRCLEASAPYAIYPGQPFQGPEERSTTAILPNETLTMYG